MQQLVSNPKLVNLGLRELRDARQEAEAALRDAKQRLSEIDEAIHGRVAGEIEAVRALHNKHEGTVDAMVDGLVVKSNVPKIIKWDTQILDDVGHKLVDGGADPDEIFELKITIPETKYRGLADWMKKLVDPARTLTHGKEKITLEDPEN